MWNLLICKGFMRVIFNMWWEWIELGLCLKIVYKINYRFEVLIGKRILVGLNVRRVF